MSKQIRTSLLSLVKSRMQYFFLWFSISYFFDLSKGSEYFLLICSVCLCASVSACEGHLCAPVCMSKPVFVCPWHLTTIHLSICCGGTNRLRLLSDGGSDAELISCSLTALGCSHCWVKNTGSSSLPTVWLHNCVTYGRNQMVHYAEGCVCSMKTFLFGIKLTILIGPICIIKMSFYIVDLFIH